MACFQLTDHDSRGTTLPGADIHLDAAGAALVPVQMSHMANFGATFGIVGYHQKPFDLNLARLLTAEVDIKFSVGYPTEIFEVTDDLVKNWDKHGGLLSETVPYEKATEAFQLT